MVWDLGVTKNPKMVGLYSGIIDSAFAFAQIFSVCAFEALSDKIGRKPTILIGTFGVATSVASFGLCKTFAQMIAARALAGLFSGYVVVIHSVLGEITDKTNRRAVYPIYSLCYPIGAFIGPLIGGANRGLLKFLPSILHPLFNEDIYLLPSMTGTTAAMISLLFVFTFLEETLPSKIRSKVSSESGTSTPNSSYGSIGQTDRNGYSRRTSPAPTAAGSSRSSSMSTRVGEPRASEGVDETVSLLKQGKGEPHEWTAWELLELPHLRQLIKSSIALSFVSEAYVIVFVLFAYSEIKDGGLGFKPADIGFALATAGFASFVIQLLVLPFVLGRYNPSKTFTVCMMTWPIGFAIPPILNAIARASSDNGAREIGYQARIAVWIGIWVAQGLTRFGCMAYSINMVIARQSSPDQRAMTTTTHLNQFSLCVARMFAPTTVSLLFILSVEYNMVGGQLVWVVMSVISLLGLKFAAPPLVS
ncbi:MFS general substrate transporter [Ceratobasidium sp. AG-I]|nr:MFS general substrate transporter [Ceratobasidium sp. AG-I]